MADIDRFTETCRAALADSDPRRAVRDAMAELVSDPSAIQAALGEPWRAGVFPIHESSDLTIVHVVWGPHMVLRPHDHAMWATIGVYSGREDNILWRRRRDDPESRIEAGGAHSIGPGEVLSLGPDAIHSVANPIDRLTCAVHVYGGDFFNRTSSEWDPETLAAQPFDMARTRAVFEEANRHLAERTPA